MAALFTSDYALLWAGLLALALFFPVRQFIWVISVRRAERDGQQDEIRRKALKLRAGITSALLVFIFSVLYAYTLLGNPT